MCYFRSHMASADEKQPIHRSRPGTPAWGSGDMGRAALIALAVWFGLQLAWYVSSLVLLVFLATLFGLAIGRGVDHLERHGVRRGIGAALITFGALGALGGALAWTAPTLVNQGKELRREFPKAIEKLQTWMDSNPGGFLGSIIATATQNSAGGASPDRSSANASVLAGAATAGDSISTSGAATDTGAAAPATEAVAAGAAKEPGQADTASRSATDVIRERLGEGISGATKYLFSFVSGTLAVMAGFVLMVFLAMYIGAEPSVYHGWILAMVPATSRAHVRVVLGEMAAVLRKWLVTQLIAMIVIGVVSMTVLLVLDVKAAFALAFIAGLMEFIPTVGPILSAVPAVLMGFVDSPQKALVVALAYWGIQFLENNLLIPYLMRGEMDLPPALTLVAQTLMTLLFGFLGLMVAVPLTAAVLVPLRMVAEQENTRERAIMRAEIEARKRGRPPDQA